MNAITIANPRWVTRDEGRTWKLYVDTLAYDLKINTRYLYSITYLGRGRGGGPMRWKVQDHSNVEGPNDIPEFNSLDEAKAWVEAIITLEN